MFSLPNFSPESKTTDCLPEVKPTDCLPELKIYDLMTDEWPIENPTGRVIYGKAHLHKNTQIKRTSGELILSADRTTKESAGLRVVLKTQCSAWYKLTVRVRLLKGDKVFVLAQDILVSEQKHRTKLTLKEPLIPRVYFFDEIDHVRQYDIFFKAMSDTSIIGVLFFSKDLEYEAAITSFKCVEIIGKTSLEADLAIVSQFPLADSLVGIKSKDLRKYGIGNYPQRVDLVQFYDSDEQNILNGYVLLVNKHKYLYLRGIEFSPFNKLELSKCVFELSLVHSFHEIYKIQHTLKHNVVLKAIRRPQCFPLIKHNEDGIIEIRSDGKILIYYADLEAFPPRVMLEDLLIPI
jgi:hypothetical protein